MKELPTSSFEAEPFVRAIIEPDEQIKFENVSKAYSGGRQYQCRWNLLREKLPFLRDIRVQAKLFVETYHA